MSATTHNFEQTKHFSLNVSLSTAFITIVLVTSLLIGVITFYGLRSFIREGIRERLRDIVALTVVHINAEQHASLQNPEDENNSAYIEIQSLLRTARDNSKDIRFMYTMRKNTDNKIVFVVDAEENEADRSKLGDVYDQSTELMEEVLTGISAVVAEKDFITDKWGTWLSCYAPIIAADGSIEGILSVDMSAQKVLAYERKYISTIFTVSLLISILVALIGLIVSNQISKPLTILEQDMERIQRFELDDTPPVASRITEIVKIDNAVDNMKNGLRSFKKYVPAKLVADLIRLNKEAVLGTEKKTITVLFSDIKDFTSISEKMPPELLSKHLGNYFFGMTKTIVGNHGTVDKFIGDAIMAFWNAPNKVDDHVFLACKTALENQKFIAEYAAVHKNEQIPAFITRMGINTGEALVGNMGYEERMSYTATGDTVNLSSRLEGLNKYYGTHILLGEAVYEHVHDRIVARLIDVVAVKGRQTGTRIYELMALKDTASPDLINLVKKCNTAMSYYLNKEWADAIELLNECMDEPSVAHSCNIIRERCITFMSTPPHEGWTGTYSAHEKY